MNNMQRKSAIEMFTIFRKCCFHTHHCQSASVFLILTTCFFGGKMAHFDIIVYIIARENVFHPCKIGRALYGVRLISYVTDGARPGIDR